MKKYIGLFHESYRVIYFFFSPTNKKGGEKRKESEWFLTMPIFLLKKYGLQTVIFIRYLPFIIQIINIGNTILQIKFIRHCFIQQDLLHDRWHIFHVYWRCIHVWIWHYRWIGLTLKILYNYIISILGLVLSNTNIVYFTNYV